MKTLFNQKSNIDFELRKNPANFYAEYKDVKMVIGVQTMRGEKKPTLTAWKGRQSKPFVNYYYNTSKGRSNKLAEIKENADSREEYKAKIKAEKKAFNPYIKIGDIFYSSWGYEQTNVSFYEVIEVVGKVTAIFKEISQKTVEGSEEGHGMACDVIPVPGDFYGEKVYRKRVGKYGIKISTSESAYKWDGKPKYKSWYY